jgi:hypothetical protein
MKRSGGQASGGQAGDAAGARAGERREERGTLGDSSRAMQMQRPGGRTRCRWAPTSASFAGPCAMTPRSTSYPAPSLKPHLVRALLLPACPCRRGKKREHGAVWPRPSLTSMTAILLPWRRSVASRCCSRWNRIHLPARKLGAVLAYGSWMPCYVVRVE